MTASTRLALAFTACISALPAVTYTHFRLVEPASWIVEDARGDPQKGFPCGGSNTDYGKPSYAVTQAVGGSTMHLKVEETIYHPGHYRVALAVNSPAELPVDPKATTETTERGPRSLSGEVMNPGSMRRGRKSARTPRAEGVVRHPLTRTGRPAQRRAVGMKRLVRAMYRR